MSDPNYETEAPPPKPPRPSHTQRQLDADEAYARRLAAQEGGYEEAGWGAQGQPPLPRRRQQTGLNPNDPEDREHSFFDGNETFQVACACEAEPMIR